MRRIRPISSVRFSAVRRGFVVFSFELAALLGSGLPSYLLCLASSAWQLPMIGLLSREEGGGL